MLAGVPLQQDVGGGTCWVVPTLVWHPMERLQAVEGPGSLSSSCYPSLPQDLPCTDVHTVQLQVIPIFLMSEFAAEAGQHSLKMCFFLFKLTFHADWCQGPRGHSQAGMWGLHGGVPCGSAAALVSSSTKICPGPFYPNPTPPLHGPGACVLPGHSQSPCVLQSCAEELRALPRLAAFARCTPRYSGDHPQLLPTGSAPTGQCLEPVYHLEISHSCLADAAIPLIPQGTASLGHIWEDREGWGGMAEGPVAQQETISTN